MQCIIYYTPQNFLQCTKFLRVRLRPMMRQENRASFCTPHRTRTTTMQQDNGQRVKQRKETGSSGTDKRVRLEYHLVSAAQRSR